MESYIGIVTKTISVAITSLGYLFLENARIAQEVILRRWLRTRKSITVTMENFSCRNHVDHQI